MKPIILFDIDSTLLNSAKLQSLARQHFRGKFKELLKKLAKREWQKAWVLLKPDLEALFYIALGRPRGFLLSPAVEDSFLNPRHYRDALFEDVLPTLNKLRDRVSLGVFSQGPVRLQHAKLYLSGIERYFEREIIFVFPPRKVSKAKQVLAQLPEAKIYFVDDRPEIAETLANHRAKVFLLRRNPPPTFKNGRVVKRVIKRVIKIESLREILDFI